MGGSATFNNVSLPEGAARLTTYVLLDQDQAGTATLELEVDTGRCDVAVTAPVNGTPVLAANDADPSTPEVADVDVVVSSTRCGAGSTVTIPVGAEPVTGAIGDDGSATLRIVLAPSANNQDLQSFTAVVTDQSGSRSQGPRCDGSPRRFLAPARVVGSADSRTVLTGRRPRWNPLVGHLPPASAPDELWGVVGHGAGTMRGARFGCSVSLVSPA